jgi:hypothetical protein
MAKEAAATRKHMFVFHPVELRARRDAEEALAGLLLRRVGETRSRDRPLTCEHCQDGAIPIEPMRRT